MGAPQAEFLSLPVTKCRDEVGRLILFAKVHGGGYLYASGRINGGYITMARRLAGSRALVTVVINGGTIAFVATIKPRARYAIAVSVPKRLRGLFKKGDMVVIRLRPIDGDGR
jgi:hypothetical protein